MRSMKKYFLLFLNVFLFVSFDFRQCVAMADLVEVAGEDAGMAVKDAATKMADDLGITGAEDINNLEDILASSVKDLPKSALDNPKILQDSIDAATEAATKSLNVMKQSGEDMADALNKFSSDSDAMEELTGKVQGSVENSIKSLAKSGEITEEQAGKMLNDLKENQQAIDDLSGGVGESAEATTPKEGNPAAGEDAVAELQDTIAKDFDLVNEPGDADVTSSEDKAAIKAKTKFQKIQDFFTQDSNLVKANKAADEAEAEAEAAQADAEKPGASEEIKNKAKEAQTKAATTRRVADSEENLVTKQKAADEARTKANDATNEARQAANEAKADPENTELQQKAKDAQTNADSLNEEARAADKSVTDAKTELESAKKELGGGIKNAVKGAAKSALKLVGEQVLMISFMTAPQMIQQAIEEELNRKAALATVAQPVKFGNWVLQVVEPCIDQENPLQSVPLYVTVPVANVGDPISKATSAAFNNSIVGGTQPYGDVKIMGIAGSDAAQRYNTANPAYYKYGKFVMSYPSQSYDKIGASLISDPSFSGLVVDLNDGYAIDATGEQVSAPPSPPLIPMVANAPQYQSNIESIAAACQETLLSKLETAGLTTTYSTFGGINSEGTASSIANYFDCDVSETTTEQAPSAKGAAQGGQLCIVNNALSQYAKAVTFGSFGSMLPMYGWGTSGYSTIINSTSFPHLKEMTVGDAVSDNILVTGSTAGKSSPAEAVAATGSTYHFAEVGVNYEAQGSWVYICANTPFAKAVQNGSAVNTVTGPYVDYVIFVDDQGTQVPLQAPVETLVDGTTDVSWPSIGINPNAKFMISLVSANMPEFQIGGQIVGWEQDGTSYGLLSTFSSTVESAISTLQSNFPGLYAQFEQHQKALVEMLQFGPFKYGNDSLEEATEYNLTDGSGNTELYVYSGTNCFATSGSDAVKDILIAFTGSAVQLPNKAVTNFVSLVTDIKYSLASDGSLVANTDAAFHSAPGTWNGTTFTPDMSKKDSLAWLPYIYNAYTASKAKGGPGLTISQTDYDNLTNYVQAQRDAWFNNFSNDQLVHGVTVGDLSIKLAPELDVQEAEANKLYVYTIAPSPSATLVQKDWFVAVDTAQPELSSLSSSMVNIAANANSAKALVSLVTGTVYDMTGAQNFVTSSGDVKTLAGLSDSVTAKHGLVLSITATNKPKTIGQSVSNYLQDNYGEQKGLTDLFDTEFQAAVSSYALMVNRPVPVGSLGGVSLGVYAGDLALGTYVYFSTAGLTDPASFEPKDLFVTVRQKSDKSLVFGELFVDATAETAGENPTQFILSLISGQVYDKHGAKFAMSLSDVSGYATTQSVYWRSYLKDILIKLQAANVKQKAAEAKEKAALEAQTAASSIDANIQWSKNDVLEIINRLAGAPILPAPYAMLKQDPVTLQYVKLSPGSVTDASEYLYTFFHVPYSKTTADVTYVGAVYTSKGELVQVIKGNVLKAIMPQYGLFGDATKLGVPMMQPSLLLDPAEKLKAGSSGTSMIVSGSANFPGYDGAIINSAIASGYSLYYSRNMNSYYVLDSANKQLIGLGEGHQYTLDGQPIPLKQSVAVNKAAKKGTFNLLLLEENQAGHMQGVMADFSHDNDVTSWTNDGSGSWKNRYGKVAVKDAKSTGSKGKSQTTAYAVTFKVAGKDKKVTYTIDNSYDWQPFMYLPLGQNDKVVTQKADMPASKSGKVVRSKGVIKYVVLGADVYAATSSGSGDYTLVAMNDSTDLKTLTIEKDANTNVPYFVIADGSGSAKSNTNTYRYVYIYNKLSDDAFDAFLVNVVAGNPNAVATGAVTVCPISFPVGPMVAPKGASGTAKVPTSRTYTLYIPGLSDSSNMNKVYANKIKEVPDSTTSAYQVFSNNISGRVYKSASGRFVAQVYKRDSNSNHAPFFSYFNRNGFVDLQTGALFDSYGNAMGSSLTLSDWFLLLNTLQITVNIDSSGVPALYYRNPAAIAAQQQQSGASSGGSSVKTDSSGKKSSAKSK